MLLANSCDGIGEVPPDGYNSRLCSNERSLSEVPHVAQAY